MVGKLNQDKRLNLFFITIAYIGIIGWGYFSYLEDIWGYFGLHKVEDNLEYYWLLTIVFSIIPVFFIPVKITRPSFFAVWIMYYLTYIPMIIGACFDKQVNEHDRFYICVAYLIGFLLLGAFNKVNLIKTSPSLMPTKYFWLVFNIITFVMLGYIIFLFKDNLSFINFFATEAVYEMRFAGREIESQSPFAGYFIMWLSNVMFPFTYCVGLISKSKYKIIISIIGMIILYMTMANKQYLFILLFLFLIYRLFRSHYQQKIFIFVMTLLIVSTVLLLANVYINIPVVNQIVFLFSSIILLRTVYTSTMMSVYYNVFFETQPHTYYSHVSGINQLIQYPFNNPLGIEVGTYFVNIEKFNANANFFITDGLAAIGLPGILIMGLICSFIFYLFDSFAKRNSGILGILIISSSAIALMNVSLFTTLISGGLILYIILIKNDKIVR